MKRIMSMLIIVAFSVGYSVSYTGACPDGYTQEQCAAAIDKAEKENKEARDAQGD